MPKTIADLMPAKVREWVYALLLPANAIAAAVIINVDGTILKIVAIATAAVNASGFTLARQNVQEGT